MKFVGLLISLFITTAAAADALQEALVARLKEEAVLPKFDTEHTSAIAGYIPISYFEYRYGRSSDSNVDRNSEHVVGTRPGGGRMRLDDDRKRYFRVPWSDDGDESHTLRVHFKSFTEMAKFADSRRLSAALIDTEQREIVNQRQYNVYLDLVEQALQGRMRKLLQGRESELHKSVDSSGQMLGLPKVNVKDLVREMERLQKVDAEFEGIKARNSGTAGLSEKEVQEGSEALLEAVGALAKRMSETQWKGDQLQIERKRVEAKLSRIDKEIAWAKDRKLVDHLDFQRDSLERQDSVRIGFNIPFLRFDNEDRARDKAIIAAKESELARKETDLRAQLRRQKLEVMSLAAQFESMKSRLERTRGVAAKVKSVQDIELRAVLGDFGFELERDVVLVALKFYALYLDYLREQGAFAAFSGRNLLNPKWPEVTL